MTEKASRDLEDESARAVLTRELKRLRERSGKSLAQLHEDTKYDRSYLCRVESGERFPGMPVMESLDRAYDTGDLLVSLWKLARAEAFRTQYQPFMQYEAKAVIMHKYMVAIPGLLQTEDYARVVLSSELGDSDALEEQVLARVGRQELLRRDPPPSIRIILDESALRRPTSDLKIWHGQLARLIDAAQTPNIVIQVLTFAAGVHDLMGGSLSLLWMSDGSGVAYLEGSKSGELITDSEEVAAARLSYDRLRDLALSPPESLRFIERVLEESTS
ncbi:helix-turn-helix domain-containing protein [Streptomyces sp. NPDC058001]|uniref:helix-turn-helix domain-containing protein n=1 Tax=Streptomyces sp. NPDC058001 TaxID=3346300 RepID=UPI0036E4F00C